jgi:protocatechuate 3,4-dioxygenase beta subunit
MLDLHRRSALAAVAALMVAAAIAVAAQAPPSPQPSGQGPGRQGQAPGGRRGGAVQRPQRDLAPAGTAVIAGKVTAADSGRPVKRARVSAAGGGRTRTATTDENGRFSIPKLPPGTYAVTATKTGFVDGAFGQRRSLRTGTPVEVADGQQRNDVDLNLSRGGVITGRVLDEDGEPLSRARVSVLREQYARGTKELMPAGTDQSDDRGQFRIFGLPPGDYYVGAMAGDPGQMIRQLVATGRGGVEQVQEPTGYATTYYPGVVGPAEATRVKLAASQELSGIDFQLQIVPLTTVKGVVVGGGATVMLEPEERTARGRGGAWIGAAAGGVFRTGTQQDGTFTITNVTPGKYTISARAGSGPGAAGAGARTASQPLVVAGEEVHAVLTPAPGVVLSGSVTFESAGTPTPASFAGVRVNPVPLGAVVATPRLVRPAQADESGQFSAPNVTPGQYVIRAAAPRGWTMKSVYLDGRDVTDRPFDVKSENVSGINVIFTDRISGLGGAVRDGRGNGVAGLTVILFPSDESLWLPQSRRIVTARTDAAGAYRLTAVPAGDYLVLAVDDVEEGAWFDPVFLEESKSRAVKVAIGEGEQRTADLKAPS